ncbi:MAG: hypothetical protein ABIN13_18365 [Mucilaginibacter sp.]
MITLDSMLDDIMRLDFDTREMLLEILKKRQIEARRDEFLKQANGDLKEYRAGKLKAQTAEEVIEELSKL